MDFAFFDFIVEFIRGLLEMCSVERVRKELGEPGRRSQFAIRRANRASGLRGEELRKQNERDFADMQELTAGEIDELIDEAKETSAAI